MLDINPEVFLKKEMGGERRRGEERRGEERRGEERRGEERRGEERRGEERRGEERRGKRGRRGMDRRMVNDLLKKNPKLFEDIDKKYFFQSRTSQSSHKIQSNHQP